MFKISFTFCILIAGLWLGNPLCAKEVDVSAQEMYAAFDKHGPQAVIAHGRKAVKYIQSGGDLNVFNDGNNKDWWPDRPFFSPIIVMRCDELRDVTHPITIMREALLQPGMVKKFADLDGQKTFFILCRKVRGIPQGVWMFQRHFWPGTTEPLKLAVMLMPVKGTPYQLQLFYPTEKYTLKQLNRLLLPKEKG